LVVCARRREREREGEERREKKVKGREVVRDPPSDMKHQRSFPQGMVVLFWYITGKYPKKNEKE